MNKQDKITKQLRRLNCLMELCDETLEKLQRQTAKIKTAISELEKEYNGPPKDS